MEDDKLLQSSSSESSVSSIEKNETIISQYGKNLGHSLTNVESQTKQKKTLKLSKKHFILLATIIAISLLTLLIIISLMLVLTVKTSQLLTQQHSETIITEDNQRQIIKMANGNGQNQITLPEIVVPPVTTSSLTAESITLNCEFNAEVSCYWTRDGQTVDIEDRYQYVQVDPQKSDCSIRINSVDDIDFGSWQCGCHGNDRYNGIKSEAAILSKSLALVRVSSNQSASIDDSVVLECSFNRAVSCVWLRNGSPTEIADRYSFVQNTASNNNNDCSIKINAVQSIDFAAWTCGDSDDPRANSSPILLSKKTQGDSKSVLNEQQASNLRVNELVQKESAAVEFRKQPSSVEARKGSTVHLECEFAQPVTCAWLRNEQHVDIQGRYQYKDNDNNEDCSITITNLQSNDKGEWICSSMADSNGDGLKSQTAFITLRS